MSIKIAVFASGRGSLFEAIVHAIKEKSLDAEICGLVTDQPHAPVVERARNHGIEVLEVPLPEFNNPQMAPAGIERVKQVHERRLLHEAEVMRALEPHAPHFLVLAGYMRLFTPEFIEKYRSKRGYSRIVNIHPSLLPLFPGKRAYEQAYYYGVKVTGATIHFVESYMDDGPICMQAPFVIQDTDTLEDVENRGIQLEREIYPKALQWILAEKFTMEERLIEEEDGSEDPAGRTTSRRFCVRKN